MGITKKPAVKAAKRGRPVGSKNKSKVADGQARIKAVKKDLEAWPFPAKVDWQKLSERLQEALASQIKENEALEKIVADFNIVARIDTSLSFWERFKYLLMGKL